MAFIRICVYFIYIETYEVVANVIVEVIVYWYIAGFQFSDKITFYWFSTIFGYIFQAFVQGFEGLDVKIIENEVSGMTSEVKNQIQQRNIRMDNDKR